MAPSLLPSLPMATRECVAASLIEKGGGRVSTLLFIVLIVLLLGAAPAWPYSRDWGYVPSGTLGLVLVVFLVLLLMGRI